MSVSFLVNRAVAQHAVELVEPTIKSLLRQDPSRPCLHVVVLDPAVRRTDMAVFEDAILYERSFGTNEEKWSHNFVNVARSKAEISWRTGMSTHVVQATCPHLYLRNDTKYGGGVVLDGIVVATSGKRWPIDVFIATCVAAAIRSLALMSMEPIMADGDRRFL